MDDARAIAEETARASYGRLLAWLSSRSGDVAAAEDALADAFRAALENWPGTGVPAAPEAWILTAARRKLVDIYRRRQTQADYAPALALAAEEAQAAAAADGPFPDERLKLLFICAHPAIDAAVRTPLMLQTVMGLGADRIASAFLISPAAMSGRLVRAKRKIKTAAIPFETPDPERVKDRLPFVLEAIYAAFTCGWDRTEATDPGGADLAAEALFLARLTTGLLPEESEAWGLLALMAHAHARREARRINGAYIPLAEHNTDLWDRRLIAEAERALSQAWRLNRIGPYQIEAAIQSAHTAGRLSGRDTSEDIVLLYKRLVDIAPTIGAHVGYAAALANSGQIDNALRVLDDMEAAHIKGYQSYWAVRAHILSAMDKRNEAKAAYQQAIGLSQDNAARAFLQSQMREKTA
ncbi:MAG: RNA polymerase sigma factor [Hyphococcus sp.]